ncbi:MAG: tetratricopeptide repeat protein [Bacteroidaceae bacterium]|nr:tetratricopeptide repeat protein [Bacteroidaceae bacterium]
MEQPWRNIIYLFVLLLSLTAQAQRNEDNIDARKRAVDYFHLESTSLMEQERYDEAFELLRYCHELDSSSSAIRYFLAPYYSVLGKEEIAGRMLEDIVRENPDNEAYNEALVNHYARIGNWEAAIAVYERIIDTAQSKSEIYKSLYSLYYNNDNFEKALDILDRIERLEGSSRELTAQRLQLYMLQNRYEDVVSIIKQAIEENPDDTRFMTFLGEVYTTMGKYEQAEETFRKVLEIAPGDILTLEAFVDLYAKTEKSDSLCNTLEALIKSEKVNAEERISYLVNYVLYKETTDSAYIKPFYQELLQLPYDRLELHQSYAEYLEYKKSCVEELIPVYEKIVELDSENISAIIKLLQYAIEADDEESVLKYTDEALLYLPQMLELYFYKGFSLYLLGNKKEAIEIYRQGLGKRDAETEPAVVAAVFTTLADTYHELDMRKECYAAYDSALVYDPYRLDVLNNYSYYLSLENRDLQKALEMSHKTITAEPDSQTYLDTYAWILFKLKRYEEAKAYAEKIISLNEEMSYVVLHHIGDIFAKCGNIDSAVTYWQKAREAGDETKILYKKIKKRKYYNGTEY